MTTYLLQRRDGRLVLDTVAGLDVIETVEADCWIAAKELLGFELTAAQKWLLERFRKKQQQGAAA